MSVELVLLGIVAVLAVLGLSLAVAAATRAAATRRRERTLAGRVGALRGMLERHAAEGFQDVERMFVELRAAEDPQTVDAALRAAAGEMERLDAATVRSLRALYERLGLLALHQRQLRDAEDWRTRADSALLLGHLGVTEAIPALVAALRDPDEDGSTVKAAAARALGMMSAPGTAEALVAELAEDGGWSSPRIAEVLVELGDAGLRACIDGLDHESANVRAWSCRVLGQLGDVSAVGALRARLLDRSGAVRTVAAEALGLLGGSAATPSLVQAMLRDPAAQVRAAAARALGRAADPASLSALVDALRDPDPWTRIRAVEAIESLHPDEPELLLEAVRSGGEAARAAALALERTGHVQRWLEQLTEGPSGAVAALEERLSQVASLGGAGPIRDALRSDPDLRVRARAARLLGHARDVDSVEELARACGDGEWPVRLEALKAWVETAPDTTEPAPLLAGLDDGEELVRVAALEGLVLRGDVGRVPPDRLPQLAGQANLEARAAALELVRGTGHEAEREVAALLCEDPAPTLRASAVAALGRLCEGADDPAFPTLIASLGDPDEGVRAAAATALGRVQEAAATQALVQASLQAGPSLREEITAVLASRGLDALYDELDTFMASDHPEARLAVLWTLGKIGDERGVPLLVAALQDPRAEVRASAVGALGKIPSDQAAAALLGALSDPDARTRAAVVNALGRIGSLSVVGAALRQCFADPDPFVRGRTCVAVGRLGDEDGRDALVKALAGEDPTSAVLGLALLGGADSAREIGALMHGPLLARLDAQLQREDPAVAAAARAFLGIGEPGADRQSWLGRLRRQLGGSRDAEERLRALELLASFDLAELLDRLGRVVAADPDPRIRLRAVSLLAAHARPGDPALLRGLRDPDAGVRLAALSAKERLGPGVGSAVLACATGEGPLDEAVVGALVALHRSDSLALADLLMGASVSSERVAAVAALGEVGRDDVLALLVALQSDEDTAVRVAVAEALGRMHGRGVASALDSVEAAVGDPAPEVRCAALLALIERGPLGSRLQAVLRAEPTAGVRASLVAALGTRGDEPALTLLASFMADPHPSVRRAALLAALASPHSVGLTAFLEAMEAADPVEAQVVRTEALARSLGHGLRRVLRDGPQDLRVSAARVLSSLDAGRFEDALLAAAEDPSPAVRIAALDGLARCDTEPARQAMLRAARDPDSSVSALARAAVAGAG